LALTRRARDEVDERRRGQDLLHLNPISDDKKELVDQNCASWNQIAGWLRQLDLIRAPA